VAVLNRQLPRLALVQRKTQEREHELFFNCFEVFRDTPFIDDVFESRSLPIRSIAVLDKDSNDGGGDGNALVRLHKDP
jgi:hypothetical protein